MDKELRAAHLKARKSDTKEDWDAYENLHRYYCPHPRGIEFGRRIQICPSDLRLSPAHGYRTGLWCYKDGCKHWVTETVCKDCKQVNDWIEG